MLDVGVMPVTPPSIKSLEFRGCQFNYEGLDTHMKSWRCSTLEQVDVRMGDAEPYEHEMSMLSIVRTLVNHCPKIVRFELDVQSAILIDWFQRLESLTALANLQHIFLPYESVRPSHLTRGSGTRDSKQVLFSILWQSIVSVRLDVPKRDLQGEMSELLTILICQCHKVPNLTSITGRYYEDRESHEDGYLSPDEDEDEETTRRLFKEFVQLSKASRFSQFIVSRRSEVQGWKDSKTHDWISKRRKLEWDDDIGMSFYQVSLFDTRVRGHWLTSTKGTPEEVEAICRATRERDDESE